MSKYAELPAVTDTYNNVTLSYGEMKEKMNFIASGLQVLGVQKGDKIAHFSESHGLWVPISLGILKCGAIDVIRGSNAPITELDFVIGHADCSGLILRDSKTFTSLRPYLKAHNLKFIVITYYADQVDTSDVGCSVYSLDDVIELGKKNEFKTVDITRDDASTMLYTSGTTGFSKGVMIPYRALWSNLDFALKSFGPHVLPGDNLLSTLPMAHCYGMACEIIFGFMNGCHIWFLNRQPSPSLIMEVAGKVKPRMLLAVPLVVEKIVRKHVYPKMDKHRARYLLQLPLVKTKVKERARGWINDQFGGNLYQIMTGGAPMNHEIEKFLMDVGFPITSGYGATETAPMISFSDWKDHVLGSCGTVVPNMEMKIHTKSGIYTPGEQGEVIARGLNTMLGYYKNPEATSEVLDADGWFHTGDLGTMSEDGHLFILGRIKNMLLGANGQNIYPEEIEDKLNSMPMVTESLIVQRDQKLVALVYPDQDDIKEIPLSTEEVMLIMEQNRNQLNQQLPSFSRISEIRLVDREFQKTAKRSIKRYLYK